MSEMTAYRLMSASSCERSSFEVASGIDRPGNKSEHWWRATPRAKPAYLSVQILWNYHTPVKKAESSSVLAAERSLATFRACPGSLYTRFPPQRCFTNRLGRRPLSRRTCPAFIPTVVKKSLDRHRSALTMERQQTPEPVRKTWLGAPCRCADDQPSRAGAGSR